MNELIQLNEHWYVLSNKKIKDPGGYYYHPKGMILPIIEQSLGVGKKVIASTDKSLGLPPIKDFL